MSPITELSSRAVEISNEIALQLYRTMLVIRQTEEELARCHQRGLIFGACHTYVGQEAIATAVCAHLNERDTVFSTHRGHGHALAKGAQPKQLIAELFGRASGLSHGRGGSMHLFAPEIGMMGTSGIVGPCILQATGAGYAFQLLQTPQVGVAFFGDGAVNNGAFHEGLNLASIWKLPTLFICENNQYATEVPFAYSSGNPRVGNRGSAYGMPSHEVDGNDVQAIYRVAGEAIRHARQGGGPTLIECKTYRTRAHAEGMGDFTYRTKEEVEQWKHRCPLTRWRQQLLASGVPELALQEIDDEVRALVAEAVAFAEQSPYPDANSATKFVYQEPNAAKLTGDHIAMSRLPSTPPAEGRETTYMKATHEALASAMASDARIFVLGEGIGKRGGNFNTTVGLHALYGDARLRDTPICERGFVGLACGAAMVGARPVVDFMFADFILDSIGEIVNQIAKMQYMSSGRISMPIVLRGCIGIGHSAATHHSGNYYALFAQVPGLRVVVPSTPYDAKGLLTRALRGNDPVMFLEHRELLSLKGFVPEHDYELDFGSARVVREGRDVTVVALARMVHLTLSVCDELARDGISVELIDPRTISPLDVATILQSVHKTGRLLIVDEAFGPCGFAADIAAQVVEHGFNDLDAPIQRLHGAFTPTPYSPPLEGAVIPTASEIARAVRSLHSE